MTSCKVTRQSNVKDCHVASVLARDMRLFKQELCEYLDSRAYLAWSVKTRTYTLLGISLPRLGLVRCPLCKTGMLMMIRSQKTRKRFIGCSNYASGCTASSPLLQRAKMRALKQPCVKCAWPIVIYRYSRKSKWQRMCSNYTCKVSKT